MKVLVTGAAGQLGRALRTALPERGHEMVAADRARLDVTDPDAARSLFSAERPDAVINAAAWTDVDGAEADPEGAARVNAEGAGNLARAAEEIGAEIVQVSTDYVFDGEADAPYDERAETNPLQVYGRTKLAGEEAVREACARHYVVRTAWVYDTAGKNFALTMKGLSERRDIRVVSDQVGSPTYVPHLAAGLVRLLGSGRHGTWHMAGGGQASWFELASAIFAALGTDTPVAPCTTEEFPRPAPRPRFAPLVSVQDPPIPLPPWEEGVRDWARDVQRS